MSETFTGQCSWPCVCGHAKCERDESHFFGDPRPDEPSTPFCLVAGCDRKQFRPAPPAGPTVTQDPDGLWRVEIARPDGSAVVLDGYKWEAGARAAAYAATMRLSRYSPRQRHYGRYSR